MRAARCARSLPAALSVLWLGCVCPAASSTVPADPMTAADPFNPDNDFSWTNDVHPPRRDESGRFIYLPSENTPAYTSFFGISGRSCGFMYVNTPADLPREGTRIRLSVDTDLVFSVIQVSLQGQALAAAGLDVRRIYAYICSDDGQWHALSHRPGQWTYDVLQPAIVGLPEYVDGGILAPPKFYKVPTNVTAAPARAPCQDRAEWRSLDHQFSCSDYAAGITNNDNSGWCMDVGYLDPSLLDPSTVTARIEWGVRAYIACPRSCRNCFDCAPNETLADPALLLQTRREGRELDGCRLGQECLAIEGAPSMRNGEVTRTFPLLVSGALVESMQQLFYNCVPADLSRLPRAPQLPEHEELTLSEGVISSGFLVVRIVAPSQGSVIRYTVDGSEPSFSHGEVLPSGGVMTLRRSGQLRARAVLMGEYAATVRESRVASLPPVIVQMPPPTFRLLAVGHYVRGSSAAPSPCAA
eukprot:CAMPEP_0181293102 /NCGR_PEP_ID=MMETSP1101-20121128/2880_1 /TAXON_ID=46948 /ORGANISM="Rhodomonas abbreviata, Strain Caron Lab Isolate" /LENGTH=469 /DNA_ID=CAMNT_0023397655 /DNA_START=167 /DNA_END=1572 /DNA_ORIENTATION=-